MKFPGFPCVSSFFKVNNQLRSQTTKSKQNPKHQFSIKTNRCSMPRWSLDDPQIKTRSKTNRCFHFNSYKNQCFVINEHFDHEFDYRTYLELKLSIRAFACLDITSVSLLGCSFLPKQGPKSMFRHNRSCGP